MYHKWIIENNLKVKYLSKIKMIEILEMLELTINEHIKLREWKERRNKWK